MVTRWFVFLETPSRYQTVVSQVHRMEDWQWEKSTGKMKWPFSFTWSYPAPPTVKIFAYLVLHDKILTKDVLSRRGLRVDLRCVLCTGCLWETSLHLLFRCPYAKAVWRKVTEFIQFPIVTVSNSIQQTWFRSQAVVSQGNAMKRKIWAVVSFMGSACMLL